MVSLFLVKGKKIKLASGRWGLPLLRRRPRRLPFRSEPPTAYSTARDSNGMMAISALLLFHNARPSPLRPTPPPEFE